MGQPRLHYPQLKNKVFNDALIRDAMRTNGFDVLYSTMCLERDFAIDLCYSSFSILCCLQSIEVDCCYAEPPKCLRQVHLTNCQGEVCDIQANEQCSMPLANDKSSLQREKYKDAKNHRQNDDRLKYSFIAESMVGFKSSSKASTRRCRTSNHLDYTGGCFERATKENAV